MLDFLLPPLWPLYVRHGVTFEPKLESESKPEQKLTRQDKKEEKLSRKAHTASEQPISFCDIWVSCTWRMRRLRRWAVVYTHAHRHTHTDTRTQHARRSRASRGRQAALDFIIWYRAESGAWLCTKNENSGIAQRMYTRRRRRQRTQRASWHPSQPGGTMSLIAWPLHPSSSGMGMGWCCLFSALFLCPSLVGKFI